MGLSSAICTTSRRISASTPGRPPRRFAHIHFRATSGRPRNRIGGDDRGDFAQATTAQPLAVHRQSTALRIG
jgi:hypothetical protein